MEDLHVKRIVEALLFVFGQPMTLKRLGEVISEANPAQVRAAVEALKQDYAAGRGMRLQEIGGGYQLATDPELAPWMKRALQHPKPETVSDASRETLAIIAYRQPLTKADIEAIRGVDATASLDTLLERRLIRLAGRKETPGRPFLYATTPEFLQQFGLNSLNDLPKMELPAIKEPDAAEPAPPAAGQAAPAAAAPETSPTASNG